MEKLRKLGGSGSREEILLAAMETAVQEGAVGHAAADRVDKAESVDKVGTGESAENAVPDKKAEPSMQPGNAQLKSRPFPRGNSTSTYQVVIQVCERCEAAGVETTRGPLTLSPDALKAILCDAKVHRRGERNRSAVPPRVRRLVLERDRFRCRGAGCSRTRFLSVHHLVPRETGGGNQPENLITLCEGCHRAAHRAAHRAVRNRWEPAGDTAANRCAIRG
jgi:hypothetical protein